MSCLRIGVELFAHAVGYYAGKALHYINRNWGNSWIKSGKVIDVNKGDNRAFKFYLLWGAVSVGKRIPLFKYFVVSHFGYAIWRAI